jgi:hypothetical protein
MEQERVLKKACEYVWIDVLRFQNNQSTIAPSTVVFPE